MIVLTALTALTVGFPLVVPNALAAAERELSTRDWLNAAVRPKVRGAETVRLAEFLETAKELDGLTVGELRSWLPLVRRYAWPVVAADS